MEQIHQLCFHDGFAREDVQVAGNQRLPALLLKIGIQRIFEHHLQLARRAGKHGDGLVVLLDDAAGRSAVQVRHDDRTLGNQRLLQVVVGHDFPGALGVVANVNQAGFVLNQLESEVCRDGFLRQIVLRRPKAAGGDDEIAAGKRRGQRFVETADVIAHDGVAIDRNAQRAQALRDVLRVGVGNLPHEQLRSYGKDFAYHMYHTHISLMYSRLFQMYQKPDHSVSASEIYIMMSVSTCQTGCTAGSSALIGIRSSAIGT